MNDEQAAHRASQARQALDVVGPLFEAELDAALKAMIEASPEQVLRLQAYAQTITKVQKTLRKFVSDGEFAKTLAARSLDSGTTRTIT